MNSFPGAIFRIPILGWSLALLVIFSPTLVFAALGAQYEQQRGFSGMADALLFPIVFFVLMTAYTFWVFRLEITPAGMRLYRVNYADWEDFTSARVRRILILPYLHLTRRTGMSWWVPLYFVGPEPIRAALLRYAPEDNPVRQALLGDPSRVRQAGAS